MNRKESILYDHIHDVCRIYNPGEAGEKLYMTKLTPKVRNHETKIRAKTKEELEEKIIAYYLGIENDSNYTVRDLLLKAIDANSKTGKRTLQRFDKRLSELSDVKISQLNESHIKSALVALVGSGITADEFNKTLGALNKIVAYCDYEHIDIIDIKKIISAFRKTKLTGKHCFKDAKKQTKNLAFTRAETTKIVRNALRNPSYKSIAIAVLVLTGLRVGELLALELDDIYLNEGYLWIHHIEDTSTFEILEYVKENKSREVYLSDDAIKILRIAINFRMADPSDSPYLLLNGNAKDGKMHLRAIDDYMRRTIHKNVLGLDKDREARSPHDCRRTYASLEYLNGTDIYTLKNQLGHSSITQTEEYIKDVIDASERRNRLKGVGLLYDMDGGCKEDAKLA